MPLRELNDGKRRRVDYDGFFVERLNALRARGEYRVFAELERKAGDFPSALMHEDSTVDDVTVWCSNDYLGMGQNPEVIAEMVRAVEAHGAGAGGTRNISGTNRTHVLLERELANLHGKEAALIFTSGYVANMTVLSTLAKAIPGCIVYSDAKNHNSMIEGIRHSRAEKRVFKHNDPVDLERLILRDDPEAPKLIAFESVYSMDGDIAPLAEILDICERHNALSFLDEVHAVGMYGPNGAGVAERDGFMDRVDILQGTLAKAFGVIGGYIAASSKLCDFVRCFGNGFIFTTALPPGVAAAARRSVQIVRSARAMRDRHQARTAAVKRVLLDAGLPVMPSVTHIVPVLVGDPVACRRASNLLVSRHRIYVQPINYPTVDRGTERLRLTPAPVHDDAMTTRLRDALLDVWRTLDLKRAA